MAANKALNNVVFFNNVSSASISEDYVVVGDQSQMTLKVVASGTFSIKITFDIAPKGTTFKPYSCYQIPSGTEFTTITDATYAYDVDLHGIDYLRLELVSVTGTVSVYGKVVG